jgi:hypothetical protein
MDASAQTRTETAAPAMEKIRLKLRVSAAEGVSNGVPFPRWSEKWSVALFDYEEFHVTDQLIKLPFQETPPKTVCIFSIQDGSLRFRMTDPDRVAHVNGEEKKDALLTVGDKIKLAGTVTVEVMIAPKIGSRQPMLADPRAAPAAKEPLVSLTPAEKKSLGPDPDEGPTLTLTEMSVTNLPTPSTDGPVFAKSGNTVLIEEPTKDRVDPLLKPKTGGFSAEPKVELAELTPPERYDSAKADEEFEEAEEDGPSFDPVYADAPDLDAARPSFSERILAAIARVLRRDEVEPAKDRFPLDAEPSATRKPSPEATQPWTPAAARAPFPATGPIRFHEEPKVELDFGDRGAPKAASAPTGSGAVKRPRPEPQPWIPAAENAGARLRGRAVVFVVAAGVTLAIAAGFYLSVGKWLDRREAAKTEDKVEKIAEGEEPFERGLPIEVIEAKVRKMRR